MTKLVANMAVKSFMFRAILIVLLIALFFVTGCEKLTASLDKVDQEAVGQEAEPAGTVAETITEQESEDDKSASDSLTGNTVTEVKEEAESTVHKIKMTADGFKPDKLYIKVGDTVVWENTRSGSINKAMIIGVRECREVRSGFLKSGESFSWTFDKPITCTIADGVMTTKEGKILVEE